MSTRTDPRIGTELAGYRLERLLGRGGMSVVYLAEDTRLGRKVALKLLAPELAEDARFRERFLRESKLAASIDHSNVIPIYEAGDADGLLFIAMRYVDGTDLKELLAEKGKLDPARTLGILGQVASALDAAHARGLVHRDVKPANVLLDAKEDDHVYLSDFGLTKQASSDSGLTETGQFVGTPDYVAPEQIEREPVGPPADEYALTCVLYECLVGQAPFRSDSLMGTLWAHVHHDPPPLSDDLDPIVAKGLAKSPGDRYATCLDLVLASRDAIGLTAEAAASDRAAAGPLLGRREFLIGAGVAAVAVAGIVPAVILTRSDGKNAAPPLAPPDALARIEETTNKVTHVVPDLPVTRAVTSGEGAVWVLSNVASVVLRVDPETLAVTSQGVPGNPTSIAAGAGAIWVTTTFGGVGYVLVLDPRHPGSASRRIPLSYSEPRGIVVGNSSVWVLAYNPLQDHTALLRFPPASELPGEIAEPLSEVAVPGHPLPSYVGTWLVAESSDIWLLAAAPGSSGLGSGSVYRLNERTPSMIERIATIPQAESLAVGAGSVWVTSQAEPRSVFRVDPAGGSIIREPLGVRDTGPLVVSHGSLWIGDFLDGTVRRTDPSSGETTATIRVSEPVAAGVGGPTYSSLEGAHMNGLAADATALWALTSSAIEVS